MIQQHLSERVLIIHGGIDDRNAVIIAAGLFGLNEASEDDIYLLISSPGGSVNGLIAIYDIMRWCRCKINTFCLDRTAALATLLLAAGTKGKPYAFIDSAVIPTLYTSVNNKHEMNAEAEARINSVVNKVIKIMSEKTGNTFNDMMSACLTEHRYDALTAMELGYIDTVIDMPIAAFMPPWSRPPGNINYDLVCHALRLHGIL